MTLDVAGVRARFPALASGTAFFDGPGGTQTPASVADAVAAALTAPLANRGQMTAAARAAEQIVVDARRAMGDLLGADPGGVVFGRSMTALTYDVARVLARGWGAGDEIVVTRLDHDANIRPWVQAADAVGATVLFVDFDPEAGELPVDAVGDVLSQHTRLVAVTAASNLIGTRPDIPAITSLVRQAGALSYVDGVHLTPHTPVDVEHLGADFYACSPYKFFGPHLGAVAAAPDLLEHLHPDKLAPSTNDVPERFELGTLPYELLAGVTASVDFLASLASAGSDQEFDRRQQLGVAMAGLETHEDGMRHAIERGLSEVGGLVFHSRAVVRTPTVLFTVEGVDSDELARYLADVGVNAPAGSFYAMEASRALGLGDAGGVRAGVAPYTDDDDVARLVQGVHDGVNALRR